MYCVVDGGWTNWSVGNCSKSCGGGVQLKTRSCSNPLPSCGGKNCDGVPEVTVECNTVPCTGLYTLLMLSYSYFLLMYLCM